MEALKHKLNLPKCVIIPLFEDATLDTKKQFGLKIPQWAHMTVAGDGKYLGFIRAAVSIPANL